MKEFEITELMREYTDDEFNIEGENAADTDKVLNSVMLQVKPKKKVKPLFKALIAAAAAVVLAVTATAATIVISGGYKTATGLDVSYWAEGDYSGWSISSNGEHPVAPIELDENNRLVFTADGQNVDITDLVDDNTPYIYSYTNSEGNACHVVVGGVLGDYGYIDLIPIQLQDGSVGWNVIGHNTHVSDEPLEEEPRNKFSPWCIAALDQLDIWDDITCITENPYDPTSDVEYGFGYIFNAESYSG